MKTLDFPLVVVEEAWQRAQGQCECRAASGACEKQRSTVRRDGLLYEFGNIVHRHLRQAASARRKKIGAVQVRQPYLHVSLPDICGQGMQALADAIVVRYP